MQQGTSLFLQVEKKLNFVTCESTITNSPGQSDRLQGISCRSEPMQLRPPYFGAGLSQRRMRSRLPAPQDEEQKLHMLHAAQFP